MLIVDDSESFRSTAGVLLAARGFELLESVPDGEAALAAVAGDCPDGILLDINLPGRDGFAVVAAIAATYTAIRIVLTSSDTEHGLLGVLGVAARNRCPSAAGAPSTGLTPLTSVTPPARFVGLYPPARDREVDVLHQGHASG